MFFPRFGSLFAPHHQGWKKWRHRTHTVKNYWSILWESARSILFPAEWSRPVRPKKDQTRKYKWKDKQKSIKFCLLKRMAEYEKKIPMVYWRVVVTFGYKKIKQIKKLSDRYLIGLTFGQKQIWNI